MLDDILENFSISQPVSVKQINCGLVNQTYKIMSSDGVFALQSLHPIFPDEALEDMHVVTDYLSLHGLQVPTLQPTLNGDYFMRDHNNLRWRLYKWIDGRVYNAVQNEAMAYEAGKLTGTMHELLVNFHFRPKGSIPHFHDTLYVLKTLAEHVNQLPKDAQELAKRILDETPLVMIDETKHKGQVIHGDLKISNLLFDDEGHAIGIIDFDTLLFRPRAIDMGDALRSWCNKTTEDDPNAMFSEDIFSAAEKGYGETFRDADHEILEHRRATKHIALELAARFLSDMVTDNYFGFDEQRYPNRKAHNYARAIGQYHLASTIRL